MKKDNNFSRFLNWKKSLLEEIEFYRNTLPKARKDELLEKNFPFYKVCYRKAIVKYYLRKFGILKLIYGLLRIKFTESWFKKNSSNLWEFRNILVDRESISNLESVIILKDTSHFQYFFRKSNDAEYLKLKSEKTFNEEKFPKKYISIPLVVSETSFIDNKETFQVIAHKSFIQTMNKYQQYFPLIDNKRFFPKKGETVIDCGSCIGDISVIFGKLVGKKGKVFMLDPSNLHNQFAELQIKYNPDLENVLIPCKYAVNDTTKLNSKKVNDSNEINPAGIDLSNFDTVSLDEFCEMKNIDNVNYIKMDIEGYEIEALKGGVNIIKKNKPKLAISAYHKKDDIWKISNLILKILPEYQLFFRHHSSLVGESVIYAMTKEEFHS